ncbi:MAG: hypothetical protein HYV02_03445 [Deltaproteobacteria bacterium]|nr:hypothetical protein [Deltaproteobacteria bacterium]
MTRMVRLLLLLLLLCAHSAMAATTLLVTSVSDVQGEGTLRTILHYACDEPGNELIQFDKTRLSELRVMLTGPLVIPEDCQGTVTLDGANAVEAILDASNFEPTGERPGDLCTLNIYSTEHVVRNWTFVGNSTGAGVCLFGRANTVETNWFGQEWSGTINANRYGIIIHNAFAGHSSVMTAANNTIQVNRIVRSDGVGLIDLGTKNVLYHNEIRGSAEHGVWLQGVGTQLTRNTIVANGGCPPASQALPSQSAGCHPGGTGTGSGIYVAKGAKKITVGGQNEESHKNTLQYNMAGGIVLEDSATIGSIMITHNRISNNYGNDGSGIDLGDDGITMNDFDDLDSGPNRRFNYAEHLQAFPLVNGPGKTERYWTWGWAPGADRVELYHLSADDQSRELTHGGGHLWLTDREMSPQGFSLHPLVFTLNSGDVLAHLAFDSDKNSSEFGWNLHVGADADLDGILDDDETGKGSASTQSSSPQQVDTDDDLLPDSVEDFSRNGVWDADLGETAAYLADSDGDGLNDWAETHGDGGYDSPFDTNPLAPDTDGDGLLDGEEDANNNGIWDAHLGESNPRTPDSDLDSYLDGEDTCPALYNPGQETWYCDAGGW